MLDWFRDQINNYFGTVNVYINTPVEQSCGAIYGIMILIAFITWGAFEWYGKHSSPVENNENNFIHVNNLVPNNQSDNLALNDDNLVYNDAGNINNDGGIYSNYGNLNRNDGANFMEYGNGFLVHSNENIELNQPTMYSNQMWSEDHRKRCPICIQFGK